MEYYTEDIDERLKELSARRTNLEKKAEMRHMTKAEFEVVHYESVHRLCDAVAQQNQRARERNNALLDDLEASSNLNWWINDGNQHKPLTGLEKLKEAKKQYSKQAELLFPAWQRSQTLQEQLLERAKFERLRKPEQREDFQKEIISIERSVSAMERQIRSLVESLEAKEPAKEGGTRSKQAESSETKEPWVGSKIIEEEKGERVKNEKLLVETEDAISSLASSESKDSHFETEVTAENLPSEDIENIPFGSTSLEGEQTSTAEEKEDVLGDKNGSPDSKNGSPPSDSTAEARGNPTDKVKGGSEGGDKKLSIKERAAQFLQGKKKDPPPPPEKRVQLGEKSYVKFQAQQIDTGRFHFELEEERKKTLAGTSAKEQDQEFIAQITSTAAVQKAKQSEEERRKQMEELKLKDEEERRRRQEQKLEEERVKEENRVKEEENRIKEEANRVKKEANRVKEEEDRVKEEQKREKELELEIKRQQEMMEGRRNEQQQEEEEKKVFVGELKSPAPAQNPLVSEEKSKSNNPEETSSKFLFNSSNSFLNKESSKTPEEVEKLVEVQKTELKPFSMGLLLKEKTQAEDSKTQSVSLQHRIQPTELSFHSRGENMIRPSVALLPDPKDSPVEAVRGLTLPQCCAVLTKVTREIIDRIKGKDVNSRTCLKDFYSISHALTLPATLWKDVKNCLKSCRLLESERKQISDGLQRVSGGLESEENSVLGTTVLCILQTMAIYLIPMEEMTGVVSLEKLKRVQTKNPGVSQLWAIFTFHLQQLIALNASYKAYLIICFAGALVAYCEPDDRERVNRKTTRLLELSIKQIETFRHEDLISLEVSPDQKPNPINNPFLSSINYSENIDNYDTEKIKEESKKPVSGDKTPDYSHINGAITSLYSETDENHSQLIKKPDCEIPKPNFDEFGFNLSPTLPIPRGSPPKAQNNQNKPDFSLSLSEGFTNKTQKSTVITQIKPNEEKDENPSFLSTFQPKPSLKPASQKPKNHSLLYYSTDQDFYKTNEENNYKNSRIQAFSVDDYDNVRGFNGSLPKPKSAAPTPIINDFKPDFNDIQGSPTRTKEGVDDILSFQPKSDKKPRPKKPLPSSIGLQNINNPVKTREHRYQHSDRVENSVDFELDAIDLNPPKLLRSPAKPAQNPTDDHTQDKLIESDFEKKPEKGKFSLSGLFRGKKKNAATDQEALNGKNEENNDKKEEKEENLLNPKNMNPELENSKDPNFPILHENNKDEKDLTKISMENGKEKGKNNGKMKALGKMMLAMKKTDKKGKEKAFSNDSSPEPDTE